MSKDDRYSPRPQVKVGDTMYTRMDILISPRYQPVQRVEAGAEVLILQVIDGESFALVRTRCCTFDVTGNVDFIHLANTPN